MTPHLGTASTTSVGGGAEVPCQGHDADLWFGERPATTALGANHGPPDEELAAPDPPRLRTSERAGQAVGAQGARTAQGPGQLHLGRPLGEPQVGIVPLARHLGTASYRRGGGGAEIRGYGGSPVRAADGRSVDGDGPQDVDPAGAAGGPDGGQHPDGGGHDQVQGEGARRDLQRLDALGGQ